MCSTIFNRYALNALALAMLALMLVMLPGQATPPAWAPAETGLLFIGNVGQFPAANSRFLVNMGQMTLHLADDGLWLTLLEQPQVDPLAGPAATPPDARVGRRALPRPLPRPRFGNNRRKWTTRPALGYQR